MRMSFVLTNSGSILSHAPLIQKRVRGVDNFPWMTGQIKKDICQRDYFLKKARKSSRDEDWLAYKSMRNRVTNSLKRAKQTYNKKLIDNHKDNTKAFWRTMKKIIPGNKSSGGSKNINIDGVLCSEASDGKKIANGFNNFFPLNIKRQYNPFNFPLTASNRELCNDSCQYSANKNIRTENNISPSTGTCG